MHNLLSSQLPGKLLLVVALVIFSLLSTETNGVRNAHANDSATATPAVSPTHVPSEQQIPEGQFASPYLSNTEPTPTPSLELKEQLDSNSPQVDAQSAPANDDFDSATIITDFPFSVSLDTVGATVAPDDPNMGCGAGVNSNTVWYRFVSSVSGRASINTFGSNYDTVLAAFTGSRGALTPVACNDDTGGFQSIIEFQVQRNTVYYLEIADWSSPNGGQLQLSVEFDPITPITVPLDIVVVQDETGSMGDDIGTLQALAPQIWDSIAGLAP